MKNAWRLDCAAAIVVLIFTQPLSLASDRPARVYRNVLTRIQDPLPLLADYPDYVIPVDDVGRFEAPILISDADANISVRAWRFSYNARGIIEIPNRLEASKTAVVVVHPWGIDDGQGWDTPQPAGVAFACTEAKNKFVHQHAADVVDPFLKRLRDRVGVVLYSLPGGPDTIRTKLYRSINGTPTQEERVIAKKQLESKLKSFDYRGQPLPVEISLTTERPAIDYFRAFPGLDAGARYNGPAFWSLPVPVLRMIDVGDNDVVFYDSQGYGALKSFLQGQGIQHVLLCGYHTEMCVCSTAAGYENLRRDFNVFLVGDATQATFPSNSTAAFATNQAVSYAALNLLITQVSWIQPDIRLNSASR